MLLHSDALPHSKQLPPGSTGDPSLPRTDENPTQAAVYQTPATEIQARVKPEQKIIVDTIPTGVFHKLIPIKRKNSEKILAHFQ